MHLHQFIIKIFRLGDKEQEQDHGSDAILKISFSDTRLMNALTGMSWNQNRMFKKSYCEGFRQKEKAKEIILLS
jgi:hypothetical protein